MFIDIFLYDGIMYPWGPVNIVMHAAINRKRFVRSQIQCTCIRFNTKQNCISFQGNDW